MISLIKWPPPSLHRSLEWITSKRRFFSFWPEESPTPPMITWKLEDNSISCWSVIQEWLNHNCLSTFHTWLQEESILQAKVVQMLVLLLLLKSIPVPKMWVYRQGHWYWQIWVFAVSISLIKWMNTTALLSIKWCNSRQFLSPKQVLLLLLTPGLQF